ncbi:MAG: hypothetical protein V4677_12640 [Bacteroidota bacterium]
MKPFQLLFIPAICLALLQSCDKAVANGKTKDAAKAPSTEKLTAAEPKQVYDLNHAVYSDTKGMGAGGDIFTDFDCPDALDFPPIDIKNWDKIPVVNGRLPTYEETHNGMSIHHYGGEANNAVKVYNMSLPRLASIYSKRTKQFETVVIIQIVQSAKDTVVGYRYLTGGCGGSLLKNFHFLTVPEIQKVTGL